MRFLKAETREMGKIIRKDELDEGRFHLRFKGIEHYYEYDSIKDFTNDWQDYEEYVKTEIEPMDKPKSEARRKIDLFLRNAKKVPTKNEKKYYEWKNGDKKDGSKP